MTRITSMAGVGLAFAACMTTDDWAPTSAAIETIPRCPRHGCDTNAATIGDGIIFDELDLAGTPNEGGVRIRGTMQGGGPVKLGVERDRLYAFDASDPSIRFEHRALEGTVITLARDDGIGGEQVFELLVERVFTHDKFYGELFTFWAGKGDVVESYDIKARRVSPVEDGQFTIRICRGERLEYEPAWGTATRHTAIAYRGDHYDAPSRTISPTPPGDTHFVLACAGTVMAKMHMLRHTTASDPVGLYYTTTLERVAMMKAISADYCGDGRSFTVDGHPLRWTDRGPWWHRPLDLDPAAGEITSIEAIWGPEGARCLTTPRMGTFTPAFVESECGRTIPTCTSAPGAPGWEWLGHVISANPP